MKTAMMYVEVPEKIHYMLLEGDYSHLHNVFINSVDMGNETQQDELSKLVHTPDWYRREDLDVSIEELRQAIVEGAELIVCGFIL